MDREDHLLSSLCQSTMYILKIVALVYETKGKALKYLSHQPEIPRALWTPWNKYYTIYAVCRILIHFTGNDMLRDVTNLRKGILGSLLSLFHWFLSQTGLHTSIHL